MWTHLAAQTSLDGNEARPQLPVQQGARRARWGREAGGAARGCGDPQGRGAQCAMLVSWRCEARFVGLGKQQCDLECPLCAEPFLSQGLTVPPSWHQATWFIVILSFSEQLFPI